MRTARLDRGERVERRRGDARIVVVERATERGGVPVEQRCRGRRLRRREVHDDGRLPAREGADVGDEPCERLARRACGAGAALITGEGVDRRPPAAQHAARDRDALEIGTQRVDRRDGEALDAGQRGVRRFGEGSRREIAAADRDVLE